MLPSLLALQVMTVAWFFNLYTGNGSSERFGPYLSDGTCEAVRTRVVDRAVLVGSVNPRPDASPCFKVVVQENESALN
jgi:hypothetical protein